MTDKAGTISLSTAALIGGLALLLMAVTAPFSEIFVYQKLVIRGNPVQTVENIQYHIRLFRMGIFSYLLNFTCDIVAAWALYILLKPVSRHLSLLAALFRLTYMVISLIALINLVNVALIVGNSQALKLYSSAQLQTQVMFSLSAFRAGWSLAYVFFGIYLLSLGYLVCRATYIPSILGVLLIIAGLGWLIDSLRPLLFPEFPIPSAIIMFTGSFELVFMLWLLIKGSRLKNEV